MTVIKRSKWTNAGDRAWKSAILIVNDSHPNNSTSAFRNGRNTPVYLWHTLMVTLPENWQLLKTPLDKSIDLLHCDHYIASKIDRLTILLQVGSTYATACYNIIYLHGKSLRVIHKPCCIIP